eukprot:95924-Hanusia_phi.AAC.4
MSLRRQKNQSARCARVRSLRGTRMTLSCLQNEPKLPDVVVYDFLDRSAPMKQLEFRLVSEIDKARKRSEGESKVDSPEHKAICMSSGDVRVSKTELRSCPYGASLDS